MGYPYAEPGLEQEREYTIPSPYERVRFELSIRSPGRVWIDDVRIEAAASGPK